MTTKQRLLLEILRLTQKVGGFRAFIIGIIFPEFEEMLGKLSELSTVVEREDGKVNTATALYP